MEGSGGYSAGKGGAARVIGRLSRWMKLGGKNGMGKALRGAARPSLGEEGAVVPGVDGVLPVDDEPELELTGDDI